MFVDMGGDNEPLSHGAIALLGAVFLIYWIANLWNRALGFLDQTAFNKCAAGALAYGLSGCILGLFVWYAFNELAPTWDTFPHYLRWGIAWLFATYGAMKQHKDWLYEDELKHGR
tara:strand:+ start:944 stop:1288 length:345 start_codon:yes stop_codon:yes gene_type:complete